MPISKDNYQHIDIINSSTITRDQVIDEIVHYSITPTTIRKREYLKQETEPESYKFIEKYQYNNSQVLRFGINIFSPIVKSSISNYNQLKKDNAAKSIGTIASQKKPEEKAMVIFEHREAAKKLLTDYEKDNIAAAIKHVNTSNDKIVVVDFFVRDVNNNIQLDAGFPVIHTAVLYKKGNDSLIIDPSNATFSQILAGADDSICICPTNKMQIYKSVVDNKGYGHELGRDCIDIAVKLAFNLAVNIRIDLENIKIDRYKLKSGLVEHELAIINVESLKNDPSIQEITNQPDISTNMHEIVEKIPIRSKQSSNVLESKKTTAVLHTLDTCFKKVGKEFAGYRHLTKRFEKTIDTIFNLEKDLDECASILETSVPNEFFHLIENDCKLIKAEFTEITSVLGEIYLTESTLNN